MYETGCLYVHVVDSLMMDYDFIAMGMCALIILLDEGH